MRYHTLFLSKLGKKSQNLSSDAVVIGALRANKRSILDNVSEGLIFQTCQFTHKLIIPITMHNLFCLNYTDSKQERYMLFINAFWIIRIYQSLKLHINLLKGTV